MPSPRRRWHRWPVLVGDGQQALYPGGFTLADAGISVTGRAIVLRTNYQISRELGLLSHSMPLVTGGLIKPPDHHHHRN